jgi:hypothetical protein
LTGHGARGKETGSTPNSLLKSSVHLSTQHSRTPIPPTTSSVHAQRRDPGGPRRAASDPVSLRRDNVEVTGWTLNVSRGGARVVVEDTVAVGQTWELSLGSNQPRPVRVVWVREVPGGQILGIQYLDTVGTIPPYEDDEDKR